jgi:hypothetical protein
VKFTRADKEMHHEKVSREIRTGYLPNTSSGRYFSNSTHVSIFQYRTIFCNGREADHPHTSSAEVKNAWSYTSTPSIQLYLYLYYVL